MSRNFLVLSNEIIKAKAIQWIQAAPKYSRVELKAPRRTVDQNARLWAMLGDVAKQVQWHGLWLTSDDWKLIFLDGLKRETRIVPNLDNNGFVSLSKSSSDLSVREMCDMQTIIEAFGANHGVVFHDNKYGEYAA